MAERMNFEQLFNHMEKYIEIPEERWKLVTRVKRGISDPHATGCYSRDQCYFEGAIDILENIENIDFNLLMSGKICLDELPIIKKLAKLNPSKLKLPKFMKDIKAYKKQLIEIGIVNGIIEPPEPKRKKSTPPQAMPVKEPTKLMIISSPADENSQKNNENDENQISPRKAAIIQQIEDIIEENNIKVDNIKEYREMFQKNNRMRTLTTLEIKNYITKEIVAKTKSDNTTLKSLKLNNKNSALCNIL
jgi:hypothetical protein